MEATPVGHETISNSPCTPPAQVINLDPFREPPGAPKPIEKIRQEDGGILRVSWGESERIRREDSHILSIPWPEELSSVTPSKRKKIINPDSADDLFGPLFDNKSKRPRLQSVPQGPLNLLNRILYRYTPLDFSKSQIRLLVLNAGSFDDEISCRLEHFSFDSEVSFDALSYTWGDRTSARYIRIGDSYLKVTSNLEAALRHLRLKSFSRTIWIDALCIDQQNIQERNHQVQEMKRIYGSARKVLAWTGAAQAGSDNVMSKIGAVFTKNVEISHFNMLSLYALTSRSYWSRIWVAQEIAVANKAPLIIAGTHSAPCSAFNMFFSTFRAGLPPMASFLALRDRFRNEKEIDLASLLFLTAHTQATDPRDKIYALLGLAREVDRGAIIPDYSKNFEHVCKEVVRHLITHDRSLKILSRKSSTQSAIFQSWVPDFSTEMSAGELWQSDQYAQHKASGTTSAIVHFSDDMSTLRLEGSCIDTIDHVFGPFKNGRDVVDLLPSIIQELTTHLHKARTKTASNQSIRSAHGKKPEEQVDKAAAIPSVVCDAFVQSTLDQAKAVTTQPFQESTGLGASGGTEWSDPKEPRATDPPKVQATQLLVETFASRCLFITLTGFIGIGPKHAAPGDLVCLLYGGDVFYIIRKYFGQHQFVGDAYVHNAMNGELLHANPDQEFILR
ncbi:HET-domain-containing protein [Lophium mytilinum]|uniref:HET-domain-containing protein n=1 Tax=Lophium mytilinum TaxID=390894 RepID=A0A6A6QCX8_9PEZI|nr:HET-domain-containing protein [Lophium mytilinum]